MNKHRMRDMLWAFMLCAALVCSYYCGSLATSADASPRMSDNYEVVGGMYHTAGAHAFLGYAVVDKTTGKVVFSERIHRGALGTAAGKSNEPLRKKHRYWD